ncbi:DNRLRE domain-containing protein [Streptomyces sp. NBC_01235]|uniref:DNRLRE domain-containing protein n=1 Tax=Streptomyces sp. NBC_01235 TaxID=2903788 RepID=UPI002E0F3CBB|nr:DNRLRE domain-containing protein [Streptomyces sp. NBC_01235]
MSDLDTAPEPSPPGRRRVRRALAAAVALAVLAGGAAVLSLRDDDAEPSDARAKRAAQPVDEDEAQRRARKSGKKVEVATLTDEFSTTYANADGSFTYEASVAPVRAKNAEGAWAPVDTTLKRDDNGWHSVNSPYPVTFSAGDPDRAPARKAAARTSGSTVRAAVFRTGSSRAQQVDDEAESTWTRLLTMTAEGHEIDFEWPGTLPEPVVEDNRALYEGVRPGVDLMLSARDTGFTHVLVVHTPEAAAQLADAPPRYRVTSSSLTFALDPSTDVLMAKDSAGAEIAVSPTPFLWDSAGTHDTDTESAHAGTESADPEAATGTNEDPEAVEGGVAGAVEGAVAADPAAFAQTDAANDTLALPAVNGPGEGSHAATADADFEGGVLTVTPPKNYLTATENLTYPLFVDPSTTGVRANWTTVYKRYPGSSFYDGANYNEDTKEARVGFEKQTWGTARSFFKMKIKSSIKGATVSSATLKVLETHSWSCSKRTVQVWRTDPFGTKTTWNNQPAWKRKITSKSFAYGWKSNSACPNAYVNFTVTSLAQEVANNGWTDFNIGLVASTSSSAPTGSSSSLETDTYSWKKFQAEGGGSPTVAITYNRKPNTPTTLTMSPGSCDTSASPYIKIGKSANISISAKATDPDGVLKELEFELTRTDTGAKTIFHRPTTSGAAISANLSGLANGVTYQWRVRAWDADASSAWAPTSGTLYCRFVYDTDLPDSPAPVVSTDFPGDQDEDGNPEVWSPKPFGNSGSFTFAVGDTSETDIVKFAYSINSTSYAGYVCANGKQGTTGGLTASCTTPVKSATVTAVQPPSAGPNTLYVKEFDSAGNASPNARKYFFYVTPRSVADGPGDLNGDGNADFGRIDAAGNLWIDSLSQNGAFIAATLGTHDKGTLLENDATAPHIWETKADGTVTYSLVTHNGDFAPGDGVTDWVVRTPEGRLFLYPGDGYGAIDVSKRIEIRLPSNAPAPSTFSEIKSAGDITGDGQPELFVAGGTGGAELWVFSGYSGGTFSEAVKLTSSAWADKERDFVAIADYNDDGAADLTYRTTAGNIWLRKGILDSDGVGTDLKSLGTAAASLDGDNAYVSGTMTQAAFPLLYGSPDISGDGIPDIVATNSAGALLLYKGGATAIGAATTLRSTGNTTMKQLG